MSTYSTSSPGRNPRSRPILVGREREKSFLRECLDAMLDGRGSFVLASGQAGIGKTTLVGWLAREAEEEGCLILRGSCYDLTSTPPYGPWLELVHGYQPAANAPSPPPFVDDPTVLEQVGSQEALFARAMEFLTALAEANPTLLILEDLHWADAASVALLRFVGRQVGRHRVLLVATHRSDDLSRQHPLYTLLPLIVREAGAERLQVRALTADENRALIRALYPLPQADQIRLEQYVERRSEGNPLYAHELMRTLEDEGFLKPRDDGVWQLEDPDQLPVPPFVLQVIERRLGRLDEETRRMLQLAAIIGDVVPIDLWQQATEASDELLVATIRHGQNARLLEEASTSDGYRFCHGLLRQALYEEIVVPQRRAWHRRVAEVLESAPYPNPDAIAYHYQQAGDVQAATWLIKAGERAERAYAWVTAADRFEAAMPILDGQEAPALNRALLRLRIAGLRRYVNPTLALSLTREARQIAIDSGEAALAAVALFTLGSYHCSTNDLRHGLSIIDEALSELRTISETDKAKVAAVTRIDLGLLNARRVVWLATSGRLKEAITAAESAITAQSARGLGKIADSVTWASVYFGLAIAHAALGRPEMARSSFHQLRTIYQGVEYHAQIAISCGTELEAVELLYFPEDFERQRRLVTIGEEAVRKAGGVIPGVGTSRYVSLDLMIRDGDWGAAREVALAASGEKHAPLRDLGYRALATLARRQGDVELAMEVIHTVLPNGPASEMGNTYLPFELHLQLLAADIALEANDSATARSWLEANNHWLASSESVRGQADNQLGWARYHQVAADFASARLHAHSALARAGDPRQPMTLIASHRILAELDVVERAFAEAQAHLDLALALSDACAVPFERALTLLTLAELRGAQGQLLDAKALLDQSRAICDQLGARPTLDRIEAFHDRVTARGRSAVALPGGLTQREVEVLHLVAQGMTDGEVAEQLFLSPRTVSAHLRSVYNKIGVGSRAAATRFAAEHGLI